MRKLVASVALATAVVLGGLLNGAPANASTYTFDFESTNIGFLNAVGLFTTDGLNNVTAISGNVSGLAATGAIAGLVPGSSPFFAEPGHGWTFSDTYDPVAHTFNGDGILFAFGGGNYGNIYNVGAVSYLSIFNPITSWNPGEIGLLKIDQVTDGGGIGQTPLPSTWTMLIVGFAGLGFFAYRGSRRRSVAITAI